MKKLFAILAIASVVMVACNSKSDKKDDNKDTSSKMAPDTTAKMNADTTAKVDTSKKM